ncbi:MAG: hypothetical protein U0V74_16255 [Chitinophagales bacterium]
MKVLLRICFVIIILFLVFFSFVLVSLLFQWAGDREVFAVVLLPPLAGVIYLAIGVFCNIYLQRNNHNWNAVTRWSLFGLFVIVFVLPAVWLTLRMLMFEL